MWEPSEAFTLLGLLKKPLPCVAGVAHPVIKGECSCLARPLLCQV